MQALSVYNKAQKTFVSGQLQDVSGQWVVRLQTHLGWLGGKKKQTILLYQLGSRGKKKQAILLCQLGSRGKKKQAILLYQLGSRGKKKQAILLYCVCAIRTPLPI